MTMRFNSLGAFAAHLLTVEADLKITEEVCVEKACRMVQKEAKAAIGNYRFDWTPLKPETVARKATGDSPLLETGELRDSIHHVVGREGGEVVGYVGTNDPVAKYHELGTRNIPPRSFLGEAAMRQEHRIHQMMLRMIAGTFDRGGPHYRELRELFHILHAAYEQGKVKSSPMSFLMMTAMINPRHSRQTSRAAPRLKGLASPRLAAPCPAWPCLALPNLAGPRHAVPSLAEQCLCHVQLALARIRLGKSA